MISAPADHPTFALLQRYATDLPELFLSQVHLSESRLAGNYSVTVDHADSVRCPHSWRWVTELVDTEEWGPVSPRCRRAGSANVNKHKPISRSHP